MIHANAEERAGLIAGLHALAAFLDEKQEVPAPRCADVLFFSSADTDSEMKAEIDGIAALIGATIDDQTAGHGHYTTSRRFGPVEFRAVAIPAKARAYYDARASYSENIRPDSGEEV